MARPVPQAAVPSLCALLGMDSLHGLTLVATVPAARAFSETFGWMPLWLLGMPASACLLRYLRGRREAAADASRARAEAVRPRRAAVAASRRGRGGRRLPGHSRAA